jgi:hypothetical protein
LVFLSWLLSRYVERNQERINLMPSPPLFVPTTGQKAAQSYWGLLAICLAVGGYGYYFTGGDLLRPSYTDYTNYNHFWECSGVALTAMFFTWALVGITFYQNVKMVTFPVAKFCWQITTWSGYAVFIYVLFIKKFIVWS